MSKLIRNDKTIGGAASNARNIAFNKVNTKVVTKSSVQGAIEELDDAIDSLNNNLAKCYKTLSDCENDVVIRTETYSDQSRNITIPISEDGFYMVRCSSENNNVSPFLRMYVKNDNVRILVFDGSGVTKLYSYLCAPPTYIKAGSQLELKIDHCSLGIHLAN